MTIYAKNHIPALLWGNSAVQNFVNFFMTLFISIVVYQKYSSSLKSGMIFTASWILPSILYPVTTLILERIDAKRIMIISSLIKSLIFLWIIINYNNNYLMPLYFSVAVSGYLTSFENTIRQISIKNISTGQHVNQRIAFLSSSVYLGMIMGGALSTIVLKDNDLLVYCIFLPVINLSSLFLLRFDFSFSKKKEAGLSLFRRIISKYCDSYFIFREGTHALGLVTFLLIVALFQGYHNIARSSYPVSFLGLDSSGISSIQTLSTLAVFFGSLVYGCLKKWGVSINGFLVVFFTVFFQLCTTLVKDHIFCFVSYFIFIFLFEISFLSFYGDLIRNVSKKDSSLAVISLNSFSSLFLALSIYCLGYMNSNIRINNLNIVVVVVEILSFGCIAIFYRRCHEKCSRSC